MSYENIFLYMMCLTSFAIYIFEKLRKKTYLFSTFNIGLYIYTFDIIIAPLFFITDSSWYGLGIFSASSMWEYLNEALAINSVGYIIYILSLFIWEFNNKSIARLEHFGKKVANSINGQVIDFTFCVLLLSWYTVCFIFCQGLPLFNGKRTFYLNTPISPVYLFLNEAILMCSFYYSIRYSLYKSKLMFMIIGIITIALQGNRGALITKLLLPIAVVFVYQSILSKKNISNVQSNGKLKTKGKKKAIIKVLLILPFLIFLGLWLQFLRKGGSSSLEQIAFEFLYGNTFSDIRDGAYILKGFNENTNREYLFGKTYLAAFISFIPSSLSKFRTLWSWGRYTTIELFGIYNHFGLRGGNVMEAYINFGWIGVGFSGILQGVISGTLEKIFYKIFVVKELAIVGKEYFVYYTIYLLNGILVASSSAYNIYTLLVYIFFLIVLTSYLRSNRRNAFKGNK